MSDVSAKARGHGEGGSVIAQPTDWHAAVARWPEAWRVAWDERAAILEYDAGLDRDDAERQAFAQVLARKRKGDTP